MPSFSPSLDVYQGYKFKKDRKTPCGFVTFMQLGNARLANDQIVHNPTDSDLTITIVAVLDQISWDVAATAPIYLSGQISAANKDVLAATLANDPTEVAAQFKVEIFEYDPRASAYFAALRCGGGDAPEIMKGFVEKQKSELLLTVADSPSFVVQSPVNFSFRIGIKPQPIEQQALTFATSCTMKMRKPWGVNPAK